MKKLFLTAAAVLAFSAGNAQEMKFGAKVGVNLASQSITVPSYPGVSYTLNNVVGVNLGVSAEFLISDKFSVQPELLFSMQGAKLTATAGTSSVEETHSLNYVNIPIMAKFMVAEKFTLQAGPQIGFLMSATDKISSNYSGGPNSSTDSKSSYNSTDFGLNLGAGYDFTENISVDVRYNLGLSGVESNVPSGYTASKNRVLSLNFGYKF